jgi:hypothetical protein
MKEEFWGVENSNAGQNSLDSDYSLWPGQLPAMAFYANTLDWFESAAKGCHLCLLSRDYFRALGAHGGTLVHLK